MGRGIIKQKKLLRHQYNNQLYKDYLRVVEENRMMKEDPNGVIAPFLQRFNAVVLQNNRLSALAAALLDQLGGKAEVTKEKIESFKGFKLLIKIETPEGVDKFEDADKYCFSYELQKADTNTVLPVPAVSSECTDPNCTLPKDLKHTHTSPIALGKEEDTPPMHEGVETTLENAIRTDATKENGFIQDVHLTEDPSVRSNKNEAQLEAAVATRDDDDIDGV